MVVDCPQYFPSTFAKISCTQRWRCTRNRTWSTKLCSVCRWLPWTGEEWTNCVYLQFWNCRFKFIYYNTIHTTAHEIRPPTRDRHARYTLYRVEPVAKHPTKSIIKPSPAIDAPIATNIIWTASIQNSRKWNTWSNIMIVNDAPRYIVMQNIATPIRHITVAIIVAYGIRVMHDLQQLPARKWWTNWINFTFFCLCEF